MLNALLARIPARLSARTLRHFTSNCSFPTSIAHRPIFTMSTASDLIAQLDKLSIGKPEILEHAQVKVGPEWKAELEKAGKTGLGMTKTVSSTNLMRVVELS
jgi:hypothetical protein